jgi:hypothetical protein
MALQQDLPDMLSVAVTSAVSQVVIKRMLIPEMAGNMNVNFVAKSFSPHFCNDFTNWLCTKMLLLLLLLLLLLSAAKSKIVQKRPPSNRLSRHHSKRCKQGQVMTLPRTPAATSTKVELQMSSLPGTQSLTVRRPATTTAVDAALTTRRWSNYLMKVKIATLTVVSSAIT